MAALLTYLSGLTVTQGRLAGQPFAVLPWQRKFLSKAFAPETQSAALSVGRGNGKTALLSGVEPEHGVIRNAASPRSLLILGRWKARIV